MTRPLSYFGCNEISVSLVISPRGNFIDDVCKRGTNNSVGKPGSRYSTLLIRDDVEAKTRSETNNLVCREHENANYTQKVILYRTTGTEKLQPSITYTTKEKPKKTFTAHIV